MMSLFMPPTPGAKFHFTPKQPAKSTLLSNDGKPSHALRSWDRVPVTPVAPRSKTHKVWKRFLRSTRDAAAEKGLQSTKAMEEPASALARRGTKRLKTSHGDHGGCAGPSFLETRWEVDAGRLRDRKLPPVMTGTTASLVPSAETGSAGTYEAGLEPVAQNTLSASSPRTTNDDGLRASYTDSRVEDDQHCDSSHADYATAHGLAPISSPPPVYISPETSLILAEEDAEETSLLEDAPTSRILPSSPPAATDYTDDRSALTDSTHKEKVTESPEKTAHGIETLPKLSSTARYAQLLEDDAEFLADFLMRAKVKRDARLRDLPTRELPREPISAVEQHFGWSARAAQYQPNNLYTTHLSPATISLNGSAPSGRRSVRTQAHRHERPPTSVHSRPPATERSSVDGRHRVKVNQKTQLGLKKQRHASPKHRQLRSAALSPAFDSIAINNRVRRNSGSRNAISVPKPGMGVQTHHRVPKLLVQVNYDDPVIVRQIHLHTQKNTKANKGDAKRAPTVLRRMKLEERRQKEEGGEASRSDDHMPSHKPKRPSSKRVRWNEAKLVDVIGETSPQFANLAQLSESAETSTTTITFTKLPPRSLPDAGSKPAPKTESQTPPIRTPQREVNPTTPVQATGKPPAQTSAPRGLLAAYNRLQSALLGRGDEDKTRHPLADQSPLPGGSSDAFSLSPIASFGAKRAVHARSKAVDVSLGS